MADSNRILATFNTLAFLATVLVNGLANGLPINGQRTGEISDRFEVYFVPAGYVFSIWGLIYLSLLSFVIYQWIPEQQGNPLLKRIGWLFIVSCLANIAWILLWHYEFFPLTLLAMLIMLVSLAVIYVRLGVGRESVSGSEFWFAQFPFSLYLGWISVATIANVTAVLDYLQWNQWGISAEAWMGVMLGVVALLSLVMAWLRRDIIYLLVIAWALAGIAIKHAAVTAVAIPSWVTLGFVVLLVGLLALGWRRGAYPA